jgi:hypothetical protein
VTAPRRPLPSHADVRTAIDALADETGRVPSVLALATQLGLANTTFRRNFPDICAELAAIVAAAGHSAGANAYTKIKTDNARLRRDNRDLTTQLDLAIATNQRLSTDNEHLRAALHQARAITPLGHRHR